jgi:hypothetical protein
MFFLRYQNNILIILLLLKNSYFSSTHYIINQSFIEESNKREVNFIINQIKPDVYDHFPETEIHKR